MNSILENPVSDKTSPQKAIQVSNIRPGVGDDIAICSVKIGGLFIRSVIVRRGRGGHTYVNFPSVRQGDGWVKLVEITSPQLLAAVEQEIYRAISEALR